MGDSDGVDGRTARRDRNRDAVLDAVLDLFRDDPTTPSPAAVAERSGVSRRSVQRYFDDMDALVRAAMNLHLGRVQHLFALEAPGEGPRADRVERLVAARLRLYDALAPMARAALLRVHNELIQARVVEVRGLLAGQVEAMFAPELDALDAEARADTLAALDVLLAFEAMERLCTGRGYDPPAAHRALARAVTALLA